MYTCILYIHTIHKKGRLALQIYGLKKNIYSTRRITTIEHYKIISAKSLETEVVYA